MDGKVISLASNIDPLRVLVYIYLRRIGYLQDRRALDKRRHPYVAKITCRDGRTFMFENQADHTVEGIKIIPFPLFGGASRYSPYCPEMPDAEFGFKTSPNVTHCQVMSEAIRIALALFNNRLLKAGIHENWVEEELGCGWGLRLKLGLFQMTRLGVDGRGVIKSQSIFQKWVSDGEFEVVSPLNLILIEDGKRTDYTTVIDPHHPITEKYNMLTTMGMLTDRRFLELEAPDLLKVYEADPSILSRLWQEAHAFAA